MSFIAITALKRSLKVRAIVHTGVISRRVKRNNTPESPLRAFLNRFTSGDGSNEIVSVMNADGAGPRLFNVFSKTGSAKMRRALLKRGVADAPSIKPVKASNTDIR